MGNTDDRPAGWTAEDISAIQAILSKRVAVATARDDSVSVAVGADGTVRHWERLDPTRPTDPDKLVATVLELIEAARRAAFAAVCASRPGEPPSETPSDAIDPTSAPMSSRATFDGAVSYEDWHHEQFGSRIEAPPST